MLVLHWQQETLLKNMLQLAISELSEKKLNKKPWQPVKRIQRIAQSPFLLVKNNLKKGTLYEKNLTLRMSLFFYRLC